MRSLGQSIFISVTVSLVQQELTLFEHQPSVRTRRLAAIRCPRIDSCGEGVPTNNSTLSSKPIKNFRLCVLQGDSALYVIAELVEFYLTARQRGIVGFTDNNKEAL